MTQLTTMVCDRCGRPIVKEQPFITHDQVHHEPGGLLAGLHYGSRTNYDLCTICAEAFRSWVQTAPLSPDMSKQP